MSFKAYSAWNYQQEIEDLNRQSDKGWHLIKGGCFGSRFVYNPDICYRYQMDFQKVEDLGRYIEIFREQGWEYVNSTFNGWHFFRKLYDPSLPDSAYEIFTDRQSLEEMNQRWARVALVLVLLLGILVVIDSLRLLARPQLPVLIHTVTLLFEALFLLRGVLIMRKGQSNRPRRWDSALLLLFILVAIVGNSVSLNLMDRRPHLSCDQYGLAQEPAEISWVSFDVDYADRYYLDLTYTADKDISLTMLNEEGHIVFHEQGKSGDIEDMPLHLEKGKYEVILSYHSRHNVNLALN